MDGIKHYKLGSLFDGSGGFPLAGTLCGIEPVWAAEVEPYPIAVTRSRFPKMKHLGDISKINGAEIEPVDIITFGSPCQDLSVAGKRAGLKHEANGDEETTRSGLFMEAVRIIKEMRRATNGQYPRFALWENVPGAFSSNKGEDFRIVCEELIKIVEPSAFMPEVPKNGWSYADSYIGDGWSLAYRVFDAQYWGVPQRRRRIHLVADFRGQRAREVLFEREGVRGYFAEGRTPWQGTPAYAEGSPGADDRKGESNGGDRGLDAVALDAYNQTLTGDKTKTLNSSATDSDHVPCVIEHTPDSLVLDDQGGIAVVQPVALAPVASTLRAGAGAPKHEQDFVSRLVLEPTVPIIDSIGGQAERGWEGNVSPTLKATHYKSPPTIAVPSAGFCTEHSAKARGVGYQEEVAPTLRAGVTPATVYSVENHPADSRVNIDESGKVQTLTSRMGTDGGNVPMVMEPKDPVICLQGNGIDRADTAGCNGKGWKEDTSYTLNTIDRPAVAYSINHQGVNVEQVIENKTGTLTAAMNSSGNNKLSVCYRQGGFADYVEGEVGTLRASGGDLGGGTENLLAQELQLASGSPVTGTLMAASLPSKQCLGDQEAFSGNYHVIKKEPPHYIVRRLTPTECARLQGFADRWGHIKQKDSLTDDEYHFWLEVRNTHAAINGKKVQDYTEKQMLTWYNKLWTDSAEYKMWGNGIALPPALYCLQGITEALNTEEVDDEWML